MTAYKSVDAALPDLLALRDKVKVILDEDDDGSGAKEFGTFIVTLIGIIEAQSGLISEQRKVIESQNKMIDLKSAGGLPA